MPVYEYRCQSCGEVFEILQRMGQGAEGLTCPSCGSEQLEKVFSTFAARGTTGGASQGVGGCAPGSGFT